MKLNALARAAACLGPFALATTACAGDIDSVITGPFAFTYVAAGIGLPLLRDGDLGREHMWRTIDALTVTFALSEGLKSVVRERRPDDSDNESFPSAHASLSFVVATMEAQFHPKEAIYWYAGATLIAATRVEEKKHFVHDVLAGAALGYLTARAELSLPHGLILQPLIGQHGPNGVMLSCRF